MIEQCSCFLIKKIQQNKPVLENMYLFVTKRLVWFEVGKLEDGLERSFFFTPCST
jgi:hypothetical protein